MDELISRQAVLSEIETVCFSKAWAKFRADYGSHGVRDYIINYIKQLSPVQPRGFVHIDDVYRLISGHSNYHGDNILSALTGLAEGKEVPNPITVLDVQPEQKWIPIKFRAITDEELKRYKKYGFDCDSTIFDCPLPDDMKEVLVTTKNGDVTTGYFVANDINGGYFVDWNNDDDIVAWMPLPEPFKKE